jgi:quercetin dioxygenase-like cupin family protein
MVQTFPTSRRQSLSLTFFVVAAFSLGMLTGGFLQQGFGVLNPAFALVDNNDTGPEHGSIQHLEDIPFRKTSHVDENGKPVMKQQFLEPFVVPNFVGYSVATFKPGQTMMPPHEHESLHEFFFVIHGTGIIQKDGVDHEVKPGTFLHMAPSEKHGIWVPKDASEDLKMAVCGVTVEKKK